MNTDEQQPSLTEILTSTAPSLDELAASTDQNVTPHQCPKCPKSFMSAAGLHMHNMRVHTKQVLARGQKGFKPNPNKRQAEKKKHYPSSDKALRRQKYAEQRDRFYAMGLDARGRPFRSEHGRKISQLVASGSTTWTPERTAKFRATMRKKAREKRIQFVYPTPEQLQKIDEAAMKPPPPITIDAIRFCPHCGTNIERYL